LLCPATSTLAFARKRGGWQEAEEVAIFFLFTSRCIFIIVYHCVLEIINMGKMALSCFFIVFLCLYTGCGEQKKSGIRKLESRSKSGKNSFPAFLVGTWKAKDSERYKWEFTFEKDGTISSMRNFMGIYIKVSEGVGYNDQTFDIGIDVDEVCTLGPVEVNYDPNGSILAVKVVTDYFMLHFGDQIIEGSNIDTIAGPVSQDGLTWNAEWQSVSRMLNGPPMDFNNPSINPVIFYKVKEEESNQPSKGD
jgi:hypothetical protein